MLICAFRASHQCTLGFSKMKILIFTAQEIGVQLTKNVVQNFPDDEYEVVVCGNDAEKDLNKLADTVQNLSVLSAKVISKIESRSIKYDWLLNLWGGYIFKKGLLAKVKNSLNIHPGMLPFCRGSDPVVWAVKYSLPGGIALHQISEKVDEGAIYHQQMIDYDFPITGGELYKKVLSTVPAVMSKYWPDIRANKIETEKQQNDGSTHFRKELFEKRTFDLYESIEVLGFIRHLLAYDFGDNFSAQLRVKDRIFRAKISLEEIVDEDDHA